MEDVEAGEAITAVEVPAFVDLEVFFEDFAVLYGEGDAFSVAIVIEFAAAIRGFGAGGEHFVREVLGVGGDEAENEQG